MYAIKFRLSASQGDSILRAAVNANFSFELTADRLVIYNFLFIKLESFKNDIFDALLKINFTKIKTQAQKDFFLIRRNKNERLLFDFYNIDIKFLK